MVLLTDIYNLAPDVNEAEFLAWRLGEHQAENMSSPSVLRSDFSRIEVNALDDALPTHRFMTTADWPDMESFRNDFYTPEMQESIKGSMHMLQEPIFWVSEVLVHETKEDLA